MVAGAVFSSAVGRHCEFRRDQNRCYNRHVGTRGKRGELHRSHPDRPVHLLERVVAGEQRAWQQLVERYLGFIYTIAHHYGQEDRELVDDLVLAALEGLRRPSADGVEFARLRRYLESVERYGRRGRFTSWLALVLRNIFRDWFRSQRGRRKLPRDVEKLGELERQVYAGLAWQGLSERELLHALSGRHPHLDQERLEQAIARVERALGRHGLDRIWADLLVRRPMLLQAGGEALALENLADPSPTSRPDQLLQLKQEQQRLRRLAGCLVQALHSLPEVPRTVLLMQLLQGMSGEQIRRAMGFRKRQRVYDELARARRLLGKALRDEGFGPADARLASGRLGRFLQAKGGTEKKIISDSQKRSGNPSCQEESHAGKRGKS